MSVKTEFEDLVRDHKRKTGFVMPILLEDYLVDLLATRLDRVELIPEPSFAERYMILAQNPRPEQLKDFADQCLFFTALLPDYGQRRGLNMDYYATLGIATYYTAGDLTHDHRFTQLGNWFYYLQKFLNTAIKPTQRLELFKL